MEHFERPKTNYVIEMRDSGYGLAKNVQRSTEHSEIAAGSGVPVTLRKPPSRSTPAIDMMCQILTLRGTALAWKRPASGNLHISARFLPTSWNGHERNRLRIKRVEQCFRLLEVRSIETFGEPAVEGCQQVARLVPSLLFPQ